MAEGRVGGVNLEITPRIALLLPVRARAGSGGCLNVVLVCLSHRPAGSLSAAPYDAGDRALAALFQLAAALVHQHAANWLADLIMS